MDVRSLRLSVMAKLAQLELDETYARAKEEKALFLVI